MKAIAYSLLILFTAIHCNAQTGTVGGTLAPYVWFNETGARASSFWGSSSIDTLGAINDSIQNPLAISENTCCNFPEFSSYILNRFSGDTQEIYEFPGSIVESGHFHGTKYLDFVVINMTINNNNPTITVLYGTQKIDSFITAAIIHEPPEVFAYGGMTNLAVIDCNEDGYDDLILSERNYGLDSGYTIGRISLFLGGPGMTMDTNPSQRLYGVSQDNPVGGQLMCGKIHDGTHEYICEERGGSPSDLIATYLCRPDFQLLPTDTVWCTDSGANGGYLITEATGDSVDDILLGRDDRILIYAGGETISSNPTFTINDIPFVAPSYGTLLTDVGDVSGYGYHYLLVSAPGASGYGEGDGGGDVFLYPMQKGLKDSCVGWAGLQDFASALGTTVVKINNINHSKLGGFYCGASSNSNPEIPNCGRIVGFLGSPALGTKISVSETSEQLHDFILNQNYPNPFSWLSNISFDINDSQLLGKEVTLKIYDVLGRELYTAYKQRVDGISHTISINAAGMPEGIYYYRLACANREVTKLFSVIH